MSSILSNPLQPLKQADSKLVKICNTKEFNEYYMHSIPGGIRSYIDCGSAEFDFHRGPGLSREERTHIAWEKLLHLYLAFKNGFDVKGEIFNHMPRGCKNSDVKMSLASYIDLLRTGGEYRWGSHAHNYLTKNLTIEELVDLLESELELRTYTYDRNRTNYSIIEFADLKYDYQTLSLRFGIEISQDKDITTQYSEGDMLYPNYLRYIKYITTDEETRELQQKFIRETMTLD